MTMSGIEGFWHEKTRRKRYVKARILNIRNIFSKVVKLSLEEKYRWC